MSQYIDVALKRTLINCQSNPGPALTRISLSILKTDREYKYKYMYNNNNNNTCTCIIIIIKGHKYMYMYMSHTLRSRGS